MWNDDWWTNVVLPHYWHRKRAVVKLVYTHSIDSSFKRGTVSVSRRTPVLFSKIVLLSYYLNSRRLLRIVRCSAPTSANSALPIENSRSSYNSPSSIDIPVVWSRDGGAEEGKIRSDIISQPQNMFDFLFFHGMFWNIQSNTDWILFDWILLSCIQIYVFSWYFAISNIASSINRVNC